MYSSNRPRVHAFVEISRFEASYAMFVLVPQSILKSVYSKLLFFGNRNGSFLSFGGPQLYNSKVAVHLFSKSLLRKQLKTPNLDYITHVAGVWSSQYDVIRFLNMTSLDLTAAPNCPSKGRYRVHACTFNPSCCCWFRGLFFMGQTNQSCCTEYVWNF